MPVLVTVARESEEETNPEVSPSSQVSSSANGSGNAVTRRDAYCPETFIDQGLDRVGGCGKSIGVQELPRIVGIGDFGCDSSESSVVVRPA